MSVLHRSSRLASQGSLRPSHIGPPASMRSGWCGLMHSVPRIVSPGTHRDLRCCSSSSSKTDNDSTKALGEASTGSSTQRSPNGLDRQQHVWKNTMKYLESNVERETASFAVFHPIGLALLFNAFNIAPRFKAELVHCTSMIGFSRVQDMAADDVARWAGCCLIGYLLWSLGMAMLFRRYFYVKGVRQYGKEFVEGFLEEIKEMPVTKQGSRQTPTNLDRVVTKQQD